MRILCVAALWGALVGAPWIASAASSENQGEEVVKKYVMSPIGWVRKTDKRTTIVIDKKYQDGLLGLDRGMEVWVLYWFDRNDTPEKRAILQVHPRGDLSQPLRGVFATHSPVRPNLIAMSRCKVVSVKENVVEIEGIDAFADTPVLDMKSAAPPSDPKEKPSTPPPAARS
ncbi:MAG: SAM-dependent methyltransferase [Pirellulales bacterium]|nr:SAM-dependent methyltransferase [Pirellulales bacterium]